MSILRKFALLAVFVFLSACSVSGTDGSGSLLTDDKDYVLAQLREMPEVCAYKGRISIQYTDYAQSASFRALADKQCENYMKVTILGPFNMAMGEIIVEDGQYAVYKGGEDITGELSIGLGPYEVELLRDSLRLPPPLPDESYAMTVLKDGYLFKKGGTSIYTSADFKVTLVDEPAHDVGYVWSEGALDSMLFSQGLTTVTVTFTDKWVLP